MHAVARSLAGVALMALAACAPVPAPGGVQPPPGAGTGAGETVGGAPATAPGATAAPRDSTPSAEALRVLATIPEPLSPGQQVAPPSHTVTVAAPEAAYDSLRVERPAGDSVAVPVPEPTRPLGLGPRGRLTMPDSVASEPASGEPANEPAASGAGASQPGSPPPSPAAGGAEPASTSNASGKPVVTPATSEPAAPATAGGAECWRLQVAAPVETPMAESRRDAAQSLLLVPMVIEFEKGLYKVRTRGCMSHGAAEALRHRATDSGFDGAFVLNAAQAAPPAAHVKKPAAATPKPKHATTKKPPAKRPRK